MPLRTRVPIQAIKKETNPVLFAIPERLWGVDDVAKFLGVERHTVYRMAKELKAATIGKRLVFHPGLVNQEILRKMEGEDAKKEGTS